MEKALLRIVLPKKSMRSRTRSRMGGSTSVISLDVTDKAQNFGESIENNERGALELVSMAISRY